MFEVCSNDQLLYIKKKFEIILKVLINFFLFKIFVIEKESNFLLDVKTREPFRKITLKLR